MNKSERDFVREHVSADPITPEERAAAFKILSDCGIVCTPEDIEQVYGVDCRHCGTTEFRILYWLGNSNLHFAFDPDGWPLEIKWRNT